MYGRGWLPEILVEDRSIIVSSSSNAQAINSDNIGCTDGDGSVETLLRRKLSFAT